MMRILLVGFFALALPGAAMASAVVEALKGEVQVANAPVTQGQRIDAPVSMSTGPGGQATLKFTDGMQIVLGEQSLLRIVDFRHSDAGTNRAVFELLRGSARVVTGKIAADSPKQFFFRTPQTQLMVERPSDFTVALVNPAYITVNSGSVLASNGWGTATLGAGSSSVVAGSAAGPVAMSASAMPPTASSAMGNLATASVTAPVGGTSAGVGVAAGGAAASGFATPLVVIGAGAAGVAAAAGSKDDASLTTTTHH
jgi:hypothetical protein